MSVHTSRSALLLSVAAGFPFLLYGSAVQAQCSEQKVLKLSTDGETIADIAEECEMSKREVRKMLARRVDTSGRSDDPDVVNPSGFPSGTPLAPCGCWGPADANTRQPAPRCASGYAQARACNIMCQMGGVAWQGVCS